jgi:hypothetical protein
MGDEKKAVRFTATGPTIISEKEFSEMARGSYTKETVGNYARGTDGLAHKIGETIKLRDRNGTIIAETHNENVSDE